MIDFSKWLYYSLKLQRITTGTALAPIGMHCDVNNTACPGENIAYWIENELRPTINEWGFS